MKNLISNLKHFFDVDIINENNIAVYSHFFMRDTNEMYPINIKKMDKNNFIIHDGGSITMFLNEYDLVIDKINFQNLLNEYKDLRITENNEIVYLTNSKTILFDLSKYIQIITKILN